MATPSLAMIPSGYKAGTVYSVLPVDGTGDFDFTRASSATRVNSEGLIELVATGVPRLDYTGGGCPSLLLEPQSTNLITYSQDLSQWFKTNVVLTEDSIVSPDGGLNADKIVTTANAVNLKLTSIPVTENTVYTYSFYCNYVGGLGLNLRFFDNSNGTNIEYFDYTSQLELNKWKRVTRTFTAPVGCTNIQVWLIATSSTNPVTAYYWGVQLEQQSYATSYIPTSGSTVTRVADLATVDLTPFTLTSITETIGGVEQTPITVIPSTYTAPLGIINKITMI
jgi:hypothetical protein